MSGPARARAHMRTTKTAAAVGRRALPRALRRLGSLRTPFYRFASTALVPVPWSSSPLPLPFLPSCTLLLSLSPSVARVQILPSFFVSYPSCSLSSSRRQAGHPAAILLHVRWHACTHAHRSGVVRQRGPPDSSPAAWQTPNVPTATVDTLPNFLSSVAGREGGGRRGISKIWKLKLFLDS